MDAIENGTTLLTKTSRHWNIPLTLLFNHLYGKTRFKKPRLVGMLTIKKDQVVVAWVLSMQEVGLSIHFQQLKMKMVKSTQIRPTPF